MSTIQVTHDGELSIAAGRSRKETHWRNKDVQWSDFLARISTTQRTAETLATYSSEKKTRQDEIKDIGGFVGGYVNNGRRKSGNIVSRSMITLDLDFVKDDIWGDLTMLYGNAAALYSTHKHTPDSPRLRLIMPLDRPVMPDEYIAISRRIAGDLGINAFDDTTFQPERLMYWPSTSKDGVYVFEYQDGPWLNADEILASYHNWQDASEWPVSERAGEAVRREIKKQGDPLEKPGVVGAFCRTYTIDEAIEKYLSEEYEACDVENRYTYKQGSTAAGLVVYDDKYAYSHHGTDPASGKLCNAFDLVRLHLFALQDEDAREDTPSNKLPSYLAMIDHATADASVRRTLARERQESAKNDFATPAEIEDEEVADLWREELDIDRKGNVQATANNYLLILENDPWLRGLAINEFANTKGVLKPLPWREKEDLSPWRDSDNANLFIYLEKLYDISNESNLKRAQKAIFETRKYHPVREYLQGLGWDNKQRAETLFIDYLGAEDNEYVRAVTRKILVAAVARVFVPGIKWDYVPVIVGEQGTYKSTILSKIGRFDKGWFSDNFYLRGTKEDVEQLFGNWIIEIGELAGLSKRDVNEIKSYVSRQEDQCRLAYSEEKSFFKRQCVFVGTTNNDNFLKDATGNRRFWPIEIDQNRSTKNVFDDLTEYEIDQIWAEAVCLYKKGEPLYLSKAITRAAQEAQERHSEKDAREGFILKYLDTLLPEDWKEYDIYKRRSFFNGEEFMPEGAVQRTRVCVAEIWCECLGKDKSALDRRASAEIMDILTGLKGWKRAGNNTVEIKPYGRQKVFYRQ